MSSSEKATVTDAPTSASRSEGEGGKLFVVGLGLGDERDITLRGLDAVRSCQKVFLEAYTSILPHTNLQSMEALYGKAIVVADREMIESRPEEIIGPAKTMRVALLVVGDPFCATTHADFFIRARAENIPVEVIHNTSIMTAIGCCGLQLYNFGPSVSLCFFTEKWKPTSFYPKIAINRRQGFHTLVLLDIKVKEQSEENMLRGRLIYEPPRFMTVNTALAQLLEVEDSLRENVYNAQTKVVGMARVGTPSQHIVYGTMEQLLHHDFGSPLHCLVIPGTTHPIEEECLQLFSL